MHEVDGVKAYRDSDPLDVLPTARAFIAVMCENRKNQNWLSLLDIEIWAKSNGI